MQGAVTWETLTGMALILAAIVGVWLRIEWRVADMIKPVSQTMDAQHGQITLLREQLADHKLYAANHYAKIGDVREMRDEIIDQLQRVNNRLDQAFAPTPPPPPPPPPRSRQA